MLKTSLETLCHIEDGVDGADTCKEFWNRRLFVPTASQVFIVHGLPNVKMSLIEYSHHHHMDGPQLITIHAFSRRRPTIAVSQGSVSIFRLAIGILVQSTHSARVQSSGGNLRPRLFQVYKLQQWLMTKMSAEEEEPRDS